MLKFVDKSNKTDFDIKFDDSKRLCVYKNYFKMLVNFLNICDHCVTREVIQQLRYKEIIIDKKFSTFFTVDGLIEMIVFLSHKITRHGVVSTSLISALNERYVLDVDLVSLNDALELCVYTFTCQLLMKVS
ncbi:nucleoporin NUP188 [Aphis craccivora]|uniref:Nucleoporin NUP188 n=1 Tax=Aphis craccivora TaxID=307492 RepID=A0A6G0VZ29_APHCR|nr:nucleoporin NUP188 [Aphis craccivora]